MVEKRHSPRRAGKRKKDQPPSATGSRTLETKTSVPVSYGELKPEDLPAPEPTMLHASMVTRTALQFRAAEYFLGLLKKHVNHEAAVLYHLQAFLSAFRATEEMLRQECRTREGFEAWHDERWKEMQEKGLGALFRLRDRSVHQGIDPPNVEFLLEARHHKDGRIDHRLTVERIILHGVAISDPLRHFDEAMAYMRDLLIEARKRGFLLVDPEAKREVVLGMRVLREREDGTWERHPGLQRWDFGVAGVKDRAHPPDLF